MKKAIMSAVLLTLMCVLLCTSAFAAETVASGSCATPNQPSELSWSLTDDGVLTISGNGTMPDYTTSSFNSNCRPWNGYYDTVSSVVIQEGVTRVGAQAFSGFGQITAVSLPDSMKEIGSSAFLSCGALGQIDLNPGLETMGHDAFSSCSALTSVTIPDSLTTIPSTAFGWCESLTDVVIPEGVEEIGSYAFTGTAIGSITIPDSVTTLGTNVFAGCGSLKEVTLSTALTAIPNYAFEKCSALTSVTIPEGVTTINYKAFAECAALESVSLPESLTTLAIGVFEKCTSLKSIAIPRDCIMDYGMFQGCTSLESVTLPEGMTEIPINTFSGCTSLSDLDFLEGMESLGGHAFQGCTALESLYIPASVQTIDERAFQDCTGLVRVTLAGDIPEFAGEVFYQCTALREVTLGAEVSCVPEGAFDGCTALDTVSMSEGLKKIGRAAFANCTALETVSMPESLEEIEAGAFQLCTGLKHITVPSGVKTIGDMAFEYCSGLETVTLPEGLIYLGARTFGECTSLRQAKLPDSLEYMGEWCFNECKALEGYQEYDDVIAAYGWVFDYVSVWDGTGDGVFTVPQGIKAVGAGITPSARYGESYTSLILPEGLERICEGSFPWMEELTELKLPSTLRYIGEGCFGGCTKLVAVTGGAEGLELGASVFSNTPYMDNSDVVILGTALLKYNTTANTSYTVPEGIKSIADRAFESHHELESIVLPDSVESIGWQTFYDCRNMTSLVLSKGLRSIGEIAFYNCTGLTQIDLPDSLEYVGDDAFAQSGLTALDIPEGVTLGRSVFARSKLEQVSVGGRELGLVEFARIYTPEILVDTPISQRTIEGWYYENSDWGSRDSILTSIARLLARDLMEKGEVKDLKSAYDWLCGNCSYALESGWHLSYADGPFFYGTASCNGVALAMQTFLDELGYPNFIMEGTVIGIYGGQRHAWNEVYVDGKWYVVDATDTRVGDYSTYMISNTKAYDGFTYDGKGVKYSFEWDTLERKQEECLAEFAAVESPAQPLRFSLLEDGTYAVTGCASGAKSVKIPATHEGAAVTVIGTSAFDGCTYLTQIEIPAGIRTIGDSAFSQCIALEEIALPATVSELGADAFNGCVSLTSADLSASALTALPDVFTSCVSLREIKLPAGIADVAGLAFCQESLITSMDGTRGITVYAVSGGSVERAVEELGYAFVSTGSMSLAVTITDGKLSYRVNGGLEPGAELLLASYSEDGRMLACTIHTAPADGGTLDAPEGALLRIILVGDGYVPLCRDWSGAGS